jgi:phosphoglycerate dehydrogenase-like enzyme
MSFKMIILATGNVQDWSADVAAAVPGARIEVFRSPAEAMTAIEDADCVYGTVPPELLARARRLRWIAAPLAGLGGDWFYDALVRSNVTVTNMSGSYNEHLSAHAVGFLLYFARRFDHYVLQKSWQRGPAPLDLTAMTALIVGVGGSGKEASRQCAAFGMRVLGCDPRTTEPAPGMSDLFKPDRLADRIDEADFVLVTVPESPETLGMFNAGLFRRMKRGAYFINISRKGIAVTADLIEALRSGQLAGAGLDVIDPEPLPDSSPLWSMPNVLITPHIAISGAPYHEKWRQILLENCRRFAAGQPLINVVDKERWF